MSGVYLIGLLFMKCSDIESLMGNKPVYKIKKKILFRRGLDLTSRKWLSAPNFIQIGPKL